MGHCALYRQQWIVKRCSGKSMQESLVDICGSTKYTVSCAVGTGGKGCGVMLEAGVVPVKSRKYIIIPVHAHRIYLMVTIQLTVRGEGFTL